MNLKPESLDALSLHLKNKQTWDKRLNFYMKIEIDRVSDEHSRVDFSCSGHYIRPHDIINKEEKAELLQFIREHLTRCIEKRVVEAKKVFKEELLGDD